VLRCAFSKKCQESTKSSSEARLFLGHILFRTLTRGDMVSAILGQNIADCKELQCIEEDFDTEIAQ
jgi:hypothetical protein